MSEPVSNAEIEDVLSSIRRLVSEDTRTTIRSRVEEETRPVVQDRLVLTPSLRVTSDEPEEVHEEDQVEEMVEAAADLAEIDLAEPEWDEDTAADAHEEDAGEKPWTDPDATLYEAAAHADPAHDVEDDEDTEVFEAEDEPQFSDDDRWSDDAPEEAEAVAEVWHEDAQDDEDTSEDTADYHEPEEAGLAGAVEALGAAMAETEGDQWEPHGDETPDLDVPETEPLEWRDDDGDDNDLSAATVTYMDEDFDEDTDDVALFADDETILDEATLRELVTDIVREELQGALGERITRNVRKLVRREINRALSVQDLE